MKDHRVGSAFCPQHIEHLGVCLSVVDHQRLPNPLSQVYMPREGLPLHVRLRTTVQATWPIHIHTGFTDSHHPRMGCQFLDLGTGIIAECIRTGRVQRHRGVNPRLPVGGPGYPACGVQVVGDGDHRAHANRGGALNDRNYPVGVGGPARIEVGMGVNQGR